MKTFILFLATLACITFGFAQPRTSAKKQALKDPKHHGITNNGLWHITKIANEQVRLKSYYNAVDNYHKVYDSFPDNEYLLFKMANAYYQGRDYKNAEKYYLELVTNHKKTKYGMAWFELGETFKYNGKYDAAQKSFSKFSRVKTGTPEVKLAKKWMKNAKNYCQYATVAAEKDTLFFETELLPEQVNSGYTDFAPTSLGEDKLMFASLMKDSVVHYKHGEDAIFNINLYESQRKDDETWSEPILKKELSEEFDHVANGVYGPDSTFYYTKCYQDPRNEFVCHIFTRKILSDGSFDNHEHKLNSKINKHGYTTTQPTFGKFYKRKGKKKMWYHVMYFVSDRVGGVGGRDIWYSVIDNGKHAAPVNCGKSINTVRDEITPYYDQEKSTLFFSSNYKYGLGGHDVFSSKGKLKRFGKAENMGMPFNSSYDDTYFVPSPDTVDLINFGYLVSNRPGGHALASETCCDDIYRYESFIPDSVTIDLLLSELIEVPDTTQTVMISADSNLVAQSKVNKIDTVGLSGVRIGYMKKYLYDKKMKEDASMTAAAFESMVTWIDTTGQDGQTSISFLADKDYVLLIEKDEFNDTIIDIDEKKREEYYSFKRNVVDTVRDTVTIEPDVQSLTVNVEPTELKKDQKFILEDMYFEYNMDAVKSESEASLDLLYEFLVANEGVKIEIAGHTDGKGNEDYNLDLSKRRAESVMEKMLERGVASNRMEAKGYGETQPIAPNTNQDGSDNPKGRRLNRRTEIVILSNKKKK